MLDGELSVCFWLTISLHIWSIRANTRWQNSKTFLGASYQARMCWISCPCVISRDQYRYITWQLGLNSQGSVKCPTLLTMPIFPSLNTVNFHAIILPCLTEPRSELWRKGLCLRARRLVKIRGRSQTRKRQLQDSSSKRRRPRRVR